MAKTLSKIVENITLIKVEKTYRPGNLPKYFYSIQLEGIEDELLLETDYMLDKGFKGKKIKYILNEDNIVSNLEIL
jgi:hypothetical protein